MEKTNRLISRWFSNIVGVVTVVGYAFIIVATIVLLFKSPETLFTLGTGIGALLGWTMLMGIYTLFCAIFQMMDKQVELPQGVAFKKPKIVWE